MSDRPGDSTATFLPKSESIGILQSSKIKLHVELPRIPSLSSFFPKDKPSVGFGTRKALIPLCFRLLSVVANTTVASDSNPFVIQALVPFKIKPSLCSTPVVLAAPASLPFPTKAQKNCMKINC